MKKVAYGVLCVLLVLGLSSCGKNGTDSGAYKPSLMYDDALYGLSSTAAHPERLAADDENSLEYVGTVEDTISGGTLPTQNFQANGMSEILGHAMYSSEQYPDSVFVSYEDGYYRYDKM